MPTSAQTNQIQKQPPAKAARDLLATRTDLASEPFGQLVSLFARGQDIPPASIDSTSTAASDSGATTNLDTNTTGTTVIE
jgi:hypothetical protein